jgi:hypothetical protein
MLGGSRQHAAQELAVAGLQFVLVLESDTGRGDPLGKRIADPLELIETGDPWLGEVTGDRGLDCDAGESLDGETGELMLEAGNLTPQLGAREALVASHSKRRERLSIEQIRHKDRIECKSPGRR